MANNSFTLLCENGSKIIFVSGYAKGKPDKVWVKEIWWRLHSHVYDVSERNRDESGALIVANKSADLATADEENVDELREMLLDMPRGQCGITRVVFAHSHGAKIVFQALKEDSLLSFLESKSISDPTLIPSTRMKEIRDNLAVITLGGIQEIPPSFARICDYLIYADDVIGKGGEKLFGTKHGEKINSTQVGNTESGLTTCASEALLDSLDSSADISSQTSQTTEGGITEGPPTMTMIVLSLAASSTISSNPENWRHSMRNYLEPQMKKKISRVLRLSDAVETQSRDIDNTV